MQFLSTVKLGEVPVCGWYNCGHQHGGKRGTYILSLQFKYLV